MRLALSLALLIAPIFGLSTSTCVNFPSGFVPFSSISYVTAADSAGDHLVVGVPAPGALSAAEVPAGTDRSTTFTSEKEMAKLTADWPVSRLIDIWNSFAGVAPFTMTRSGVASRRCAGVARNRGARQDRKSAKGEKHANDWKRCR
jgi:hypothetical protein